MNAGLDGYFMKNWRNYTLDAVETDCFPRFAPSRLWGKVGMGASAVLIQAWNPREKGRASYE
jgi:hypothetical protein